MSNVYPANDLNLFGTPGEDPARDMAALQFASQLLQPIQPGQQTSWGNFGQAISSSVDYLRKLRENEAASRLRTRATDIQERGVDVQERGVDIQQQNANTAAAKVDVERGDAPYNRELKSSQAEYYRSRAKLERHLSKMERTQGLKFDKGIWDVAQDLAGEAPLDDPKAYRAWEKKVFNHYNSMARRYNQPEVPPPPPSLDEIGDESLLKITPAQEQTFLRYYGEEGRMRLDSARTASTSGAKGKGKGAESDGRSMFDFLRPTETKFNEPKKSDKARLAELEALLIPDENIDWLSGGVIKQVMEGRKHIGYVERKRLEAERDALRKKLGVTETDSLTKLKHLKAALAHATDAAEKSRLRSEIQTLAEQERSKNSK